MMQRRRLSMPCVLAVMMCVLWLMKGPLGAQAAKTPAGQNSSAPSGAQAASNAGREYSGMYSFRKEGEFVQVTVEDGGRVTGFVSRYGDGESDKGEFLDQFFKTAKLDGSKLSFTTQTVHGVWFVFDGAVQRGAGKMPDDEDYFALKGTLTESSTDADKHTSSQSREVLLKRFPGDVNPARAAQN